MSIITSSQNAKLKLVKSLSDKKSRDNLGLFLVEGENICKDIPSDWHVEFFVVDEKKADVFLPLTAKFNASVYLAKEDLLKKCCDTVSPQGILAVVKKKTIEYSNPVSNAVLLDAVSDPGNLGTILRTAAAADFLDIYLLDCADVYSPKAVRSSMGGIFRTRCHIVDEKKAIEIVSSSNSVALSMSGENSLGGQSPMLLVAGSEAHGIRESILKSVKTTFSLSMKNNVESLNVAVALSIAMYMSIGGYNGRS